MKSKRFISLSILTALSIGLFSGALAVKKSAIKAEAYYTPGKTYDVSDTASELESYYTSISDSSTGNTLLASLRSLNNSKKRSSISYNTMGTSASSSPFIYTDYSLGSTNVDSKGQRYGTTIASFYTKTSATGWNREHMWPNSHGGNLVEGDILHTRPTISSENSNRGNSFYVEGMCSGSNGWDPYTAGYEEWCRGECARVIFYSVVANSNLSLIDLNYHATSNKNRDNLMGNINTLIKWHFEYTPNEYEINRNNGAEYLQGNRNPFVDHPEYVAKIWGDFNSTVANYCSTYSTRYSHWKVGSYSTYGTNDALVGVALNKTTVNLEVGNTTIIRATSTDSSVIRWTTSDSSVVALGTTQSGSGTDITLTAGQAGTAVVTASATIGGETYTATCNVTVADPYIPGVLERIEISGGQKTIFNVGDAFSFGGTVTAYYSNGEYENVTYATTFSGYNMNEAGTQVVTASYTEGGITKTTTYEITVNPVVIRVRSVALNSYYVSLNVGETYQLEATINPSDATNKNVSWSSMDYDGYDDVVDVDENGLVTALSSGFSTVTVTTEDGNKTAECIIEVLAEPTPPKPTPAKSGCGGNVIAASIILSSLALTGFVVLLIVKVKKRQK